MHLGASRKTTVSTVVAVPIAEVWRSYKSPAGIKL